MKKVHKKLVSPLIKADAKAETEGLWFVLNCGMAVKLARVGSEFYELKKQARLRSYAAEIQTIGFSRTDRDKANRITIDVMAHCVILDWLPVTYRGAEFPYTPGNAMALLSDSGLHDIRDEIAAVAQDPTMFQVEE